MPTTPSIQVPGPTGIYGGSAGATLFGYSDNDNLPSISVTDHQHEIKTVLSGNAPEEIVQMGLTARISVALVKWDETEINTMLIANRGSSAQGKAAVGTRLVGQSKTFKLVIKSLASGGAKYEFPRAYLVSDGQVDSQWGNRERVLTLNFMAIPDAEGITYTYSATG
jgi:hypothetical protein